MKLTAAMIVFVSLIVIVQTVAMICALRLVRRTRYNAIWILCIIGIAAILVERVLQVAEMRGHLIRPNLIVIFGSVASLCVSLAIFFAHRLINYIDRLDRQRSLFNKRILTAVLRAEERSHSTFAKELHDGMGPLLSSAKLSLSALPQDNLSVEQREILKNTSYVIDEAIRSVREISNNMSPQLLMDFGLAQGIQGFISRSMALQNLDVEFSTNLRKERFNRDVEVIIYRVVCELINNSLKHSHCTAIRLSLAFDGSQIALDYSDNGRGFNPHAVMDCGMGLSNISSRINSLNGTCEIVSSRGHGMSATIRVGVSGSKSSKK